MLTTKEDATFPDDDPNFPGLTIPAGTEVVAVGLGPMLMGDRYPYFERYAYFTREPHSQYAVRYEDAGLQHGAPIDESNVTEE
jgi:hypothetical protein